MIRHWQRCGNAGLRAARRQRARCLLLCALAATQFGTASITAAQVAEAQSRFARTVVAVQDGTPEVRSDFAAEALSQLADAYAAETRLARHNDQRESSRAWSATVDHFAAQLDLLRDDVELGLPVDLNLEGDGSLAITVAQRTVIVSHPRLSQQGALEQGILKAFCARQDCGQIQPDPASLAPIPASGASIRPQWNFTERGSACAYDGITVRFSSGGNAAHARLICEQFLQEVAALAAELAAQNRHAVTIEWQHLALHAAPGNPEHTVHLNALGDTALVVAPLLHASPELLRQVAPWLRQHVEGTAGAQLDIDANRYGWQQP